jgi:uncharacterized membrane protein (UPF0127 family)
MSDFARALRTRTPGPVALVNARTGAVVAGAAELALTRTARRRGLLKRTGLDRSAALVLAPCAAIHTIGMRFAIDVLFVDRTGEVVKIVRALPPWRLAGARRAHATIELAAGALQGSGVTCGDRLAVSGSPSVD